MKVSAWIDLEETCLTSGIAYNYFRVCYSLVVNARCRHTMPVKGGTLMSLSCTFWLQHRSGPVLLLTEQLWCTAQLGCCHPSMAVLSLDPSPGEWSSLRNLPLNLSKCTSLLWQWWGEPSCRQPRMADSLFGLNQGYQPLGGERGSTLEIPVFTVVPVMGKQEEESNAWSCFLSCRSSTEHSTVYFKLMLDGFILAHTV